MVKLLKNLVRICKIFVNFEKSCKILLNFVKLGYNLAEDRTDLAENLNMLCSAELEEPAFSNSGATEKFLLIIRLCTVGSVGVTIL